MMSEEKISKQTFSCNICNYSTTTRAGYARHISSVKHKTKAEGKKAGFHCECCNFQCDYIKDYNVHVLSIKHNNMVSSIAPTQCSHCKRVYSSKKNLWRHKQTCKEANVDKSDDDTPNSDSEDIDKNTLIEVITSLRKEVDELKKSKSNAETTQRDDLIIEILKSNKEMQNCMQTCMIQQTTEVKNMVETVAKNMGGTNNTNNSHNNNHTNSHNKTFNMNFFLNEQCKNAMNIYEFARTLNYNAKDLEENKRLSFTEHVTKKLEDRIRGCAVEDRPIHCSDTKREKLHIKTSDGWVSGKESEDLINILIEWCNKELWNAMREWVRENPSCMILDTPAYKSYIEMNQGVIGPATDAQERKMTKTVIRKVAEETAVDKEKYAV
jgi:hypothetical protein